MQRVAPWRFLNQDGSTNIRRSDRRYGFAMRDLHHRLLSISWTHFFFAALSAFLGLNTIFAGLYFFAGESALIGVSGVHGFDRFLACFFFSVQTLGTIGYGSIHPGTLAANWIVVFESFCGLFFVAIMTGLLFSRFSRPSAKVIFSRHALIRPRNGKPCVMFRAANARGNHIVEADIHVTFARLEKTLEGETFRGLYELKLLRSRNSLFGVPWTVVHVIDEQSPLFGLDAQALEESMGELIVSITGLDDIFHQTVHARFSYSAYEIVWNQKFVDLIEDGPDGVRRINMARIHDYEPIPSAA